MLNKEVPAEAKNTRSDLVQGVSESASFSTNFSTASRIRSAKALWRK